jgi:hypothetical protein
MAHLTEAVAATSICTVCGTETESASMVAKSIAKPQGVAAALAFVRKTRKR